MQTINTLVDVTNYVMREYGQPLHAFDFDRLAGGQIVVRRATGGEQLTTLDGKARALDADDLLICDRDHAQVLAGVMGGATSEVTPTTSRVLLECANFQATGVRRSSKRHALHTESSHRFERGADVSVVPEVLDRAAAMIAELGGGVVLAGRLDVYPAPRAPTNVTLRPARVGAVLGSPVSAEESARVLEGLGFRKAGGDASAVVYEVPLSRNDVTIEEDLIEEIARVRGYELISPSLPSGLSELSPSRPLGQVERRVRSAMAGQGYDEVVNYSFVAAAELAAVGALEGAIAIGNPLSEEQSVMRTTLLPSLVVNVRRAARHQAEGVRFYELARSYRPHPEGGRGAVPVAIETYELAGVVWGARDGQRSWSGKELRADFYDAKAAVEGVLKALHIEGAVFEPLESAWYHPRAAATVRVGPTRIGTIGELHPKAARRLDAPAGTFLFQLDVGALMALTTLVPQAAAISKYPKVLRDLAVVVPQSMASDAVRAVILEVGKPLVRDATVFDVYVGPQVGEGKKNLAYGLSYSASDHTLTDAEVNEAHQRIVAEVTARLGGALR